MQTRFQGTHLCSVYVVVQFCHWFNFYFLLFHIRYHILTHKKEQKKKIEPRIKLNYNIYMGVPPHPETFRNNLKRFGFDQKRGQSQRNLLRAVLPTTLRIMRAVLGLGHFKPVNVSILGLEGKKGSVG